MSSRGQVLGWALAALAASALLVYVVRSGNMPTRARWSGFLAGDPQTGAQLFVQKGCARCHSVNGSGSGPASDLGSQRPPDSGPEQLVASMWNQAPRMWESMRAAGMTSPAFSEGEMADVFAYLDAARYIGGPGDSERGRDVFGAKGCALCHSVRGTGGHAGPELSDSGVVNSPAGWTRAMWNHAPVMESRMRETGVPWPKFDGREMNDLVAYVHGVGGARKDGYPFVPGDPDHGWRVFETNSCRACHSVRDEAGDIGPMLGPEHELPPTILQFAGSLWNHSPEMWQAMEARKIERPTFEAQEMADLIALLFSFRSVEPGGSAKVGQALYAGRLCSYCHGPDALGTSRGPALRKRGKTFSSSALAAALWRHGPEMYERAQELRLPWPTLDEGDVGHLISFLNSWPKRAR